MPNELVLVRHGESEANVIQKAEKAIPGFEAPPDFYERHDWQHRLSPRGVEQAKLAGAWLMENLGDPAEYFDRCYVSSFMRARETARHIGIPACKWLIDDRLRERDWGIYGATPFAERSERFAATERLKAQSRWYTTLDGGESPSGTVFLSSRDFWSTLHRDMEGKRAMVVAHGDRIGVFRFLAEYMLPEEYEAVEKDKSQDITNCSIIRYRRVNPFDDTDVRPIIKWRQMIRPDDPDNSPFGGEWVELPGRRFFNGADLQQQVEAVPRLLDDETAWDLIDLIEASRE